MRRAPAIAPSSSSQRTSRQRTCSTAGSWSVCNAPCGEARIACAVWHGGHTAPEDGATLPAAHLNHHSASVSSPHSVVGRRNVPAPRHPQHRTPMHGGGRKTTDVVEGSGVIHISACRADTARHLLLESPDNARELFVGECNPGGPWPQAIPTYRARRAVAKQLGAVIRSNAADSHLRPRIATPSIFRVKIALCGFPSATQRDVSLHIAWYGRHSNHRTAILQ